MWSPLTEDYKPPVLLFRDEHLKRMLELTTFPIPANIWVQGDKGLGKTLTARFLSAEIEARRIGKCYYVECQKTFTATLKELRDNYKFKIPTYVLSPATITRKIVEQTEKDDLVCLIFDEPRKAMQIKDFDNGLYWFYNSFLGKRKLSIIILSQIRFPVIHRIFASDTLSRMRFKPILFENYDVPQIVEILKQRLQIMLDPNQYELKAIVRLARHIRRIGGDIREALDLLATAIKHAEKKVDVEAVEYAIEWGKTRWWKNELTSLPPHWAYILYLTAEQSVQHSEGITTQSQVKTEYEKKAKEIGFQPVGRRSIYYIFNKLAEKGYFEQQKAGAGRQIHTILAMDEGDRRHILKAGKEMEWDLIL